MTGLTIYTEPLSRWRMQYVRCEMYDVGCEAEGYYMVKAILISCFTSAVSPA